ncbi:undecaprenyl-diphosphate phosphatase [Deinococcus cellulosilyticus]|uniref:Undecaprenyl-diphosphatase n=1 Tax=Deinococcus cellulosilyticus (strain DSM 18568 / NBRC 106333 / KACC 11606 / 5516J-15) TaxID=1223518 RepID=A0A511NA68_DEIC1|nr:undecaprenyl-diphosphate phosphatase [Deinococcus cellulosilyticus]GEM49722.1 undecaprenyl-diphosphatase [Deinococcus cellulosilyticus NBRC 106333 = KACC 11606]
MFDWIKAAIMGVVEGITEFLPISSTGHLIVTSDLLKFTGSDTFEIVIQLGGVLAVLCFYFRDILKQAQGLTTSKQVRRFWASIVLACFPALTIAFFFKDTIQKYLFNSTTVAISLIVGGIVLWIIESLPRRESTRETTEITFRQALIVGLAQICSLVPGVSRSASTIMGGMLSGMSRSAATGFSFYLSIPVLGGASLYSLVKDLENLGNHGAGNVVVGLVVSFITSLLAIGWLLKFISKHNFKGFAIYRIIAGIVILVLVYTGVISNTRA